MFKITLSDVGLLTNSIPIIAEIIDEGVFKIDQNGMSLVSPDRAMISVIDFRILSSAFDSYKVEAETMIGLNLDNFAAVLKRVRGNDKITLESTGKSNRLKITIENSGLRTFEIPVIDVNMEKPPIDQLSFNGAIEMASSVFEEGISDAEVIGDSVILEAGPEIFKMYARGDISSAHLEMKKKDKDILKLTIGEAIKSQYPLEYLKKIIKASKMSKNMVLEFGNDYPMRLTFKDIDKMQLSFILAPRVSEE